MFLGEGFEWPLQALLRPPARFLKVGQVFRLVFCKSLWVVINLRAQSLRCAFPPRFCLRCASAVVVSSASALVARFVSVNPCGCETILSLFERERMVCLVDINVRVIL